VQTFRITAGARKREEHLSSDGKWRSFPKVPHLLQYVISGNYFGKVKINGKTIRQSLETTVWSTAQLRLNDFLKEHRENRNKVDCAEIQRGGGNVQAELENDTTIKPRSKEYRLLCLGRSKPPGRSFGICGWMKSPPSLQGMGGEAQ
jgi:hypothetical protein